MTAFDTMSPDVRDLVAALCDEEAEFLVVRGFGAADDPTHRNGDVGIFVRPAADNAARVWRALHRFGIPVAAAGLTENDLTSPGMAWQIGTPPRTVDVITDVAGMTFDQAWQSRVVVAWNGHRVGALGSGVWLGSRQAAAADDADTSELDGELDGEQPGEQKRTGT